MFPPLPLAKLEELANDIQQHGLIEPVTLLDGMLLDGDIRWDASEIAGVEVRTTVYEGNDPIAFVLARNGRLKQLTLSQKAMAIARLVQWQRGPNRYHSLRRTYPQADMARQAGISKTALESACSLLDHAEPHIIAMVDNGEISVRLACEAVRKTPRDVQCHWTKGDAEREGRRILNNYPSRAGHTDETVPRRKSVKPKREPVRTIHVPYGSCQFPTAEEAGIPDDLEERYKWQEKHGRVPLWPSQVRHLKDCDAATAELVTRIAVLAKQHNLTPQDFFDRIDQMLAYVPIKGKTNGEQWDFAKMARTSLERLKRTLPGAIEHLISLRDALRNRKENTRMADALTP
jgi:hypothetical protein